MKDFLKKLYPFITTAATTVGGPVGGAAAAALGKALGMDKADAKNPPSVDELAAAYMAATPDQRLAAQKEEHDFQARMEELDIKRIEDMAQIAFNDRDSARKREMTVKDRMPATLAILAVAALMGCIALVAFAPLGDKALGAVLTLIGFVGASYKDVYGYFFGSSAGSEEKTALLAQK
jgi:hypothetical protein